MRVSKEKLRRIRIAESKIKMLEQKLFEAELELLEAEQYDEAVMSNNQDVAIEILENGKWKTVGVGKDGPSTQVRAKFFTDEQEAKKSGIYRRLVDNMGYSEENNNLKFVTREENLGL